MMQRASLLCSSPALSLSIAFPNSHGLAAAQFLVRPTNSSGGSSSSSHKLSLNRLLNYKHCLHPLYSSATQEIVETSKCEPGLVEIGYIISVHGLQGEIRVKPDTDFPELRLSKPGKRWLRQQVSGREQIREVELVEGRAHPAQKSWIVKFTGIDTVDQAKQLVGSALLVREEDRPELEDGEFYTRDLFGMRVILKETGESVGTVVNVFNTGASDLLEVRLDSSTIMPSETGEPKSLTGVSGLPVLVPFVEAIVPIVDMDRREMQITPPKGLLELNLRSNERSKKERRQLDWRQRKKFQQRLIAAKKKLCEMEQQHVFHGLRFGEKSQRSLLADEIISMNSKLLQQVLRDTERRSKRWDLFEFISINSTKLMRNTLKMSEVSLNPCCSEENLDSNFKFQQKGLHLMSKGKVAVVLVINDGEKQGRNLDPDLLNSGSIEGSPYPLLQRLLHDDQKFLKMEGCMPVPLIMVCPAHEIQNLKKLFLDHDYFAFDHQKVWFLEEEKLPVISSSVEEEDRHKILMKSPWEILQSPVGSGGVISLLSSHDVLENLGEVGVEYIEVCSINQRYAGGHSILLGSVASREADMGIQIFKDTENLEDNFDVVFSMKLMKKLTRQINKLHFRAVLKSNSHVKMVDKEWIDVIPSSPNSYEFCSSIHSSLAACSPDKVCVLEIRK